MSDQKHNQYLIEQRKHNGMTNWQALGVFWGGLLALVCLFCALWLPVLMGAAK